MGAYLGEKWRRMPAELHPSPVHLAAFSEWMSRRGAGSVGQGAQGACGVRPPWEGHWIPAEGLSLNSNGEFSREGPPAAVSPRPLG